MELQLKFIGFILMGLALVHAIFPKYFQWKQELQSLSLINRQLMYIHTFFIALVVFLMGLLCATSALEMVTTAFGRKISLGLGFFWLCRLLIQFFGYSPALWRGKAFETIVHIVFSLLWTYLSIVFIWIYLG
ncbi:MAG: hypothetical protein JST84_24465 [Acidobacteria bacterium]|nr:hypothetical protein [Acidobacteriota bacterium]